MTVEMIIINIFTISLPPLPPKKKGEKNRAQRPPPAITKYWLKHEKMSEDKGAKIAVKLLIVYQRSVDVGGGLKGFTCSDILVEHYAHMSYLNKT